MPAAQEQSVRELAEQQGMPTNIEAETFVLGSVILDDTKFAQVANSLDEDDFAIEKHRRIFLCMRELVTRGELIEYLTLSNELQKFKQLQSVGGVAYLASLTDGMPRLASIESYVRIVKNKSVLRKLIHVSQQIISNCIQEAREVDDILADSETEVMKVGTDLLRSGLESPRETIEGMEGGVKGFLDPNTRPKGLPTSFLRFDELTNGLRGGQLIVLAGRPAMGKTAMALNIASHVASKGGHEPAKTVAVFSLEMSREALLTRVLCSEAGVDQSRFRKGYLDSKEKAKLAGALKVLVESKLFIDDTANLNIIELAAKCRRLQSEHGLDLVIVDYLQLLGSKGRVESRVQEVSAFSRGLKLLAKDLDVPVLALSQLSRATENPRRNDPRPKLSDLRDSGSIEQDADVVCFIFREEVYKPTDKKLEGIAELIIGKQRNGPTGKVKLAFEKKFAKFLSPTEHMEESEQQQQQYEQQRQERYAPEYGAGYGGKEERPPF
jgi:replicative DNA helicase